MADSGLFGASSIDPGTASGITEREPIMMVLSNIKTGVTTKRHPFDFRGVDLGMVAEAVKEAERTEYDRKGESIKRLEVTSKQARNRRIMNMRR